MPELLTAKRQWVPHHLLPLAAEFFGIRHSGGCNASIAEPGLCAPKLEHKQVKGQYYIAPTAQEGKHKWHAKRYRTLPHACNAIARKLEAEWTSRARKYQDARR